MLRNKTDRADTKGLLEAYRNEELHLAPVKSQAQQTLAGLHREFGVTIPLGARHVLPRIASVLQEEPVEVPGALHPVLEALGADIHELEHRVCLVDQQLRGCAISAATFRPSSA